jgi:hypothetical protein
MTDSRNLLLDSDYPLDKVVYMTSGTLAVTSFGSESTTITHGLGFRPLMVFSFSDTSDFAISKTNGFLPYGSFEQWGVTVDTDSPTTIRVFGYNTSGVTKTIYWRAYALMPSNANVNVSPTASTASNFVLNTDYNYMKLFDSDYITMPSSGNTTTVTHDLGYRPRVQIWELLPTGLERLVGILTPDTSDTSSNRINLTTTTLTFRRGSSGAEPTNYHYRIYLDD